MKNTVQWVWWLRSEDGQKTRRRKTLDLKITSPSTVDYGPQTVMSSTFWKKYSLQFKVPSGTSRGVLTTKDSWFIIRQNTEWQFPAIGECSVIQGLSPDPIDEIENKLNEVCQWLDHGGEIPDLNEFPSIQFGLEMFQSDVRSKAQKIHFQSAFTSGKDGILTNGLIWMGNSESVKRQVRDKIEKGFGCIKMKIGAANFEEEIAMLSWIRSEFKIENPQIRVDANGAFTQESSLEKLKRLSEFDLHSIEQPIAPGQYEQMEALCADSPIPIALDEELIGLKTEDAESMLKKIKPQFIILKPSLVGGWAVSNVYIALAETEGIGWWITSALESNVGLMAIAQYTYSKNVTLPQGLGTGGLYNNNFESPLFLDEQNLMMNEQPTWNFSTLVL